MSFSSYNEYMVFNFLKLLTLLVVFLPVESTFATQATVIKMRGKAMATYPQGKIKKQTLK